MIINDKYILNNPCLKKNTKRKETLGVLIHSTATPGADPERLARAWDKSSCEVCVHSLCDDKHVLNILPSDVRCWGCGSGSKGSRNSSHIQLEICEPAGIYFDKGWNYKVKEGCEAEVIRYIKEAFEVACQWAAYTLKKNGIKEVNSLTVTSHYESHIDGFASNHGDPKGLFALAGLDMWKFRERVKQLMEEKTVVDKNKPSKFAEEAWQLATIKGVLDGSNPRDPLTREQLAVVLNRLHLLN